MSAELLRNHYWSSYAHVFCCFVHVYDHVDTYCSFPCSDPHESLLVSLSDMQVEFVRKPGFLPFMKRVSVNLVAFLAEICDYNVH